MRPEGGSGTRYFKFLFAVLSPAIFCEIAEVLSVEEDSVLSAMALHSGGEH